MMGERDREVDWRLEMSTNEMRSTNNNVLKTARSAA